MLLSNAIATGRVLIGKTNPDTFCGCALAMGLMAVGKEPCPQNLRTASVDHDAALASSQWRQAQELEWPWIKELREAPAGCCFTGPSHAITIISDLFLEVERGTMSLEQLIEWVAANEPAEPAGNVAADEQAEVQSLGGSAAQPDHGVEAMALSHIDDEAEWDARAGTR